MHTYNHKVKYYETDKMGITHHSNYIRWMEEARMDFLNSLGYGIGRFETQGITSPVVSVECQYKQTTTFDDTVEIEVYLAKYTGARLLMEYVMRNRKTQKTVFKAKSSHCFIDSEGRPIALKKRFPEFDEILIKELKDED